MSFDDRSHQILTRYHVSRWRSFGRLRVHQGSSFVDHLVATMVGVEYGGSPMKEGMAQERVLLIVSVATQVAVSRRFLSRFKLQFRDRQKARSVRGGGRGG